MEERLSLTEFTVLGLLGEEATHGFAISRELGSGGELGRVLTVRRSLVYRALDRLASLGLVKPVKTEPGDAGPNRVVHAITARGRRRLESWLGEPLAHIRDLRQAFLVKVLLLQRSQKSPAALIAAQKASLGPTLEALVTVIDANDPVELWRQHSAQATLDFLDHLDRLHHN